MGRKLTESIGSRTFPVTFRRVSLCCLDFIGLITNTYMHLMKQTYLALYSTLKIVLSVEF